MPPSSSPERSYAHAMGGLLLALVVASTDGGAEGFERRTQEVMHTLVTISLPASMAPDQREAAFTDAFSVFQMIDVTLNEWRPDSALSRVNAGSGGRGVEAPASLCEVVRLSLDAARRTGGLFDPTWASVRGLWRFGTAETGEVPTPAQVRAACAAVGWKKVEVLDLAQPTAEASCRIRLTTGTQLGWCANFERSAWRTSWCRPAVTSTWGATRSGWGCASRGAPLASRLPAFR